jgi:hypothetical protein
LVNKISTLLGSAAQSRIENLSHLLPIIISHFFQVSDIQLKS